MAIEKEDDERDEGALLILLLIKSMRSSQSFSSDP